MKERVHVNRNAKHTLEEASFLPGDDRVYFAASPPNPQTKAVVWTLGLDSSLPHAELIQLWEVDMEKKRGRCWGTVPLVALIESMSTDHFTIHNDRYYLRKEGWPTMEWVEAHDVSLGKG